MHIRTTAFRLSFLLLTVVPSVVWAQSSSINTFSPYTLYGIGDLSFQGTSNIRSMGGAGVANRDIFEINPLYISLNYLNPAGYSVVPRQTFLFNIGLEGANYYLKDGAGKKSSFNTFNVRDISLNFPLARRIGFGFSVTPYSTVGYRMEMREDDIEVEGNTGDVRYKWEGAGGFSQLKAGIGYEVINNLSIGAEMVMYFGNIERTFNTEITPITGSGTFSDMTANTRENVTRFYPAFGAQYTFLTMPQRRALTLGATYQVGGKLNQRVKRLVESNDLLGDTVLFTNALDKNFAMPDVIRVGVNYKNRQFSVGFDYSYQNWGSKNNYSAGRAVEYRNTNSFNVGVQYTPRYDDIRSYIKTMSYRVGFKYNDYYMKYYGQDIDEKAITVGFGFPFRMNNIDLGLEFGQRGNTRNGMIKENYFKFSLNFNLFSDYWFVKQKFR